ncbi:hypothetical protein KP509_26G028500 [Ceratopteris richardii]|uniref:pectinesterase n=1 Tax=Ceratopteris richardii TaxID=49495 RepID=A0A8T2RJI8_CERRI|nr:hypothetical protein KP509_26G028500 [Ceratopteris richardii]
MSRKGIFGISVLSSLLSSVLLISVITLVGCFCVLLAPRLPLNRSNRSLISQACRATLSPDSCESSLKVSVLADRADSPAHLIAIVVDHARRRAIRCHRTSRSLLSIGHKDPVLASAARNCEYLLRRASYLLKTCGTICHENAREIDSGNVVGFVRSKDVEAWISAVLTWENDCLSALGYVNVTDSYNPGIYSEDSHDVQHDSDGSFDSLSHSVPPQALSHVESQRSENHPRLNTHSLGILNETMQNGMGAGYLISRLMLYLHRSITSTSDALCMLDAYDTYGSNVSAWSPPSKRNLPGHRDMEHHVVSTWLDHNIKGLSASAIVSKHEPGTYSSIQKAVDDAPDYLSERYVIFIRQGIYNETIRIPYTKPYLAFVGEGMGKTVITGNLNAQMIGVSTYDTATVAIDGDNFLAYNLTFESTADPSLHQAVALRVASDHAAFYQCSFLGHQDTLYAHSLRQFYQSCRIEGTMDFIFGNSASIFQGCEVLIRPGRISSSVIAAQGRTDPSQTTGFVFDHCIINGTKEFMESFALKPKYYKVYLGRPWKMYSRTIYKNCIVEGIVRPEGWRPWKGDFALKTLFYGEFNNTGSGAVFRDRVKWAEEISSSLARVYTVQDFIQGDASIFDTIY